MKIIDLRNFDTAPSGALARPVFDTRSLELTVAGILKEVKEKGDEAGKKYSLQFDKVSPDPVEVSSQEIAEAASLVGSALKAAIRQAKENIEAFHGKQAEVAVPVETMAGVKCWRKAVAIDKVGLYIPGGTAPLFSTLLMLGIPAMLAGCKEIVVCTPSDKNGKVNAVVLYVAQLIGIKNIYKIGGVQAIAAMAY